MRAVLAVTALASLVLAAGLPASAQDAAPTGSGITIAVLDSGVDSTHAQLSGRVSRESFAEPGLPVDVPAFDVPLPEDPEGQGTAVASLAAGSTRGVAPAARILDLQVRAKYAGAAGDPTAAVDPTTEAAAIRAMDALLSHPASARVVVLSFAQGGVSDDGGRTLAQQADGLWDAGVLVVVPTGPAANPLSSASHVLTVAGREGCPPAGGPTLKPDLVAPSNGLTVATPTDGVNPGAEGQRSGTALAAAQAAGAAALLFQVQPDLPVDAAASFLRDAATDLGDTVGPDTCFGFGQLDVDTAVAWARMWNDPLVGESAQGTPGPALPLVAVGLAVAAWAGRRRD